MGTAARKFFASGTLFIWTCGAGLAASLLMIGGLLLLILANGMGYFWPKSLVEFTLHDGTGIIGEIVGQEPIPNSVTEAFPEGRNRIKLKIGNREVYGLDFTWVDEANIATRAYPADLLSVDRQECGKLFGRFHALKIGDSIMMADDPRAWETMSVLLERANEIRHIIRYMEYDVIGDLNYELETLRLDLRALELQGLQDDPQAKAYRDSVSRLQADYESHVEQLRELYAELEANAVIFHDANARELVVPIGQILDILHTNTMTTLHKLWTYLANIWIVLTDEPREANTEGGLFPAIFGTVLMVVLMSIAVVPFGVLTAFYLKEYTRQGPVVRLVRIAVNNLAGIPSIVFGIFGLGFFVYTIGGTIDSVFFAEALPTPTFGTGGILWAAFTLALMTVPVVIVATEEGLSAVPREYREGSLSLGATKFETLWKVVLPCAMPGILTGFILAISRATGEVAPLMLTGVVKLAPAMPLDGIFPFLHLDRKFMHLGFHIYDLGFQSPNVEAAKPMVYVTTLILVLVVVLLNYLAIRIRNHMKRKYTGASI